MSTRTALACGTVLSLAAVSAWSLSADLTMGPFPPLRLGSDLPADYAALAAAPFGSGPALFALVSAVFTLCLLASGIRRRHP